MWHKYCIFQHPQPQPSSTQEEDTKETFFSLQEKILKNGFCENAAWTSRVPSRRSCRMCPLCRFVEKIYKPRNQTSACIHIEPFFSLFSFVTFYLSLWHSVGRRDFSLNGRPSRDEEVKQYLWKRFAFMAFSQTGFQHHPFFCHIMWTSGPPLKRSNNTNESVVGIPFSQMLLSVQ